MTTAEAERQFPLVLVIRDPDASDQIEMFGLTPDVGLIDLDLGSSFDIRRPRRGDRFEVSDWVAGHLAAIEQFPPGHRARLRVQEVVARVCERFGLAPDGSYEDEEPHAPVEQSS